MESAFRAFAVGKGLAGAPPRYFTLHPSFTFRPITAGRPAQSKTTAMAAIDRSAFCDATGQDDADFEPWLVSYLKLAVVCMAAWRLAALVVRLPGKFIPRGTGLLIAGLLASIAGMIFDRVAKVDVMMNARTGQHNRLNIYFPVRAASTPCCCESRRTQHRGTRQQTCPAPSVADKLHVHVVHCVRDRCPAGDEELSRARQAHHRLRAVCFVVSAHRSRPAHLCELKKRQGGKRRRTAFAAGPIRVNARHRRLMRRNGWARPSLRLGGTPSVSRRFISDSSFEWEEPRSRECEGLGGRGLSAAKATSAECQM